MEYISLDLETTGLDHKQHQVLEVGAIFENTLNVKSFDEIPKFQAIIRHERIMGTAFALNMNQRILQILADREKHQKNHDELLAYDDKYNIITPHQFREVFYKWVYKNVTDKPMWSMPIKINLAGKNVAMFDLPFLQYLNSRSIEFAGVGVHGEKFKVDFHRRIIDPATLFADFKLDKNLPDLSLCLERAGLESTVTHNAIEDAWQVIQLLRTKY